LDTTQWNPLTYALVLDRPVLLTFLLSNAIRVDELLALGLKQRDTSNAVRHSKSELIDCQAATLILMMENKSGHVSTIFNSLHYLLDKKLIERIMPQVARSKFAAFYLDSIIKS
jgi:hypothetical protein